MKLNYFDRFLSPSERAIATNELAALGEQAIPILESLFNGSAKNAFGIPYNKIGALGCGFVTAKLLGPVAKPLEIYIREGIEQDHPYAIEAAGRLATIEEETVVSLARALVRIPGSDASYTLAFYGYSENPKVIEIVRSNPLALKILEKTKI